MQLSEIFERAAICDDDKARRVLNVSTSAANISADEIESGVTIERLSALAVPVFKYSTQVTIHGIIPDFNPAARPAGYKSIFQNLNGSLGVKYIAIDGAKKKTICHAARLAGKRAQWSASLNSKGLELVFFTLERESAAAAYKSFPRELIIGGIYCARGVYGGFYVVAEVGAIEEKNLWQLIGTLYGFTGPAELQAAQSAADTQAAADHAIWQARADEERAARIAKIQGEQKILLAKLNSEHAPMTELPAGECDFCRIISEYDTAKICIYTVRRRGGSLCYLRADLTADNAGGIVPERWSKFTKLTPQKRELFCKGIAAGNLFHVRGIKPAAPPAIIAPPALSAPPVIASAASVPAAVRELPSVPGGATVRHNAGKGGIEIAFPGKPAASVLTQLKACGFRWNSAARVWWNFASAAALQSAASIAGLPADRLAELQKAIAGTPSAAGPDRFDMHAEDCMARACGLI